MKRILVANVNWLGDCVMTLPAFEAIKAARPASYVAVMVPPRIRGLFDANPFIDEVILFDERTTHRGLAAKMRFVSQLRRKKIDTAICIHRSFTRLMLCVLAGITRRVGYRRIKTAWLLTVRIKPFPKGGHRQKRYLHLFREVGIPVEKEVPRMYVDEDTRTAMYYRISSAEGAHRFLVGINVSANWDLKRWPADHFSQLCDRLIEELDCGICFVGAAKETERVAEVTGKMRNSAYYDFCGQTTLLELAALMEHFDLFVSNDSGPAHLAAACGTTALVVFGPTDPCVTAPRGENVRVIRSDVSCAIPCYNTDCEDNFCMRSVKVEDVFLEARRVLGNE